MEKHLLIVACLFGLIYGQTILTSGSKVNGVANGYSSSCYGLYVYSGSTVTLEVTPSTYTNYLRLYAYGNTAVCNSTSYYTYSSSAPVDGSRYTLTYLASTSGYQYFNVYNSYYYGSSFTITATTDNGSSSGVYIATNKTYYGYAPTYGGTNYVRFYFYMDTDSFSFDMSGYYNYFYVKKGSYATMSSYDYSYYTYSSSITHNNVDACSSSTTVSGAGWYYVSIQSYYGSSYPFSFKVNPSNSSSSVTTLNTGSSYVTLNTGYNYFKVYGYANYPLRLNITDSQYNSYYIATASAPSSGCIPSSWTSSTTLAYNSRTWIFYPQYSGYQVISIYSYSSSSLYTSIDIDVVYSSDTTPLSASNAVAVTAPAYSWVYFQLTDDLPISLSLSNYANIYVKQGSLPTSSDYDLSQTYSYSSMTIDPCNNYPGYTQGSTVYIGIYYYSQMSLSVSVSPYYYSSCNNIPPIASTSNYTHYHSDVGLIVGSIFGAVAIVALFVVVIAFACNRKRRQATRHNYVQMPPKSVQLETISEKSAQPVSYVPMYAPGPVQYMPMPTANGNGYMVPPPVYGNPYVQPTSNGAYLPPPYAFPVMSAPVVMPNHAPTTTVTPQQNQQ